METLSDSVATAAPGDALAPQGARRVARGPAAGHRLTPALVSLLVGWQLWQGFRRPLDAFERSYWLVTYRHGFVRRGLTGTALAAVAAHTRSATLAAAALAVSVAAVGGLLAVTVLLLHHRTRRADAMAVLIAASPFGFDFLASQRRPDALGVCVLVGLGVILWRRPRWATAACAAAGLLFAGLVLVHEGVVLYDLPFAAVMIPAVLGADDGSRGTRTGRRRLPLRVAVLVGPPLVALGAVLGPGRASPALTAALRADAAGVPLHGLTMFDFLPDSLTRSVARVWHGGLHPAQLAMLVVGTALVAIHRAWAGRWAGRRLGSDLGRALPAPASWAVGAGVAVGAIVLFLTGIDWLRWFCALGCAGLVTTAFTLLARDRSDPRAAPGRPLPWVALPAAAYLAALAPLPTAATAGQLLHWLLLRQ